MYKKLIYTILSIVAMVSFAACSGSDSGKKTDAPAATEKPAKAPEESDEKDISSLFDKLEDKLNGNDNETDPTPTPEATPTEAPVATPTETPNVGDITPDDETPDDKTPDTDVNTVVSNTDGNIVENEQFSFKILSVEEGGRDGYAINLQLENKTENTLSFSFDNVYLNSVLCEPYWSRTLKAGETKEATISFEYTTFEDLNLENVTSIHFLLEVRNFDNWSEDPLLESTYVYYPYGEDAVVVYDYEFGPDAHVIVEDENVTFGIIDFEYNDYSDYVANVYLENHTDKYLMFSIDEVSLNGFMCDPYWALPIAPGMKGLTDITFSADDLELCEITTVTDMEFTLTAYDDNDWSADYLVEDKFVVYPLGEDAVTTYERTPKETDIVLFDTEECRMVITDFVTDEFWGFSAIAYVENKMDFLITFETSDAKVNGTDCDPFWIEMLDSGKKAYTRISWSDYKLESSGITAIETIDLPIRVFSYEDWPSPEYVNETFTLIP